MDITKKKLAIGIEDFERFRKEDFYYVDKTGLIQELLQSGAQATLFTRPRRFGKSLNMSMLKSFFELEGDKRVFDGLEISKEKELCEKYMGKYPVISISLKDIDADSYETAFDMAVILINEEARRHQYLLDSDKLAQNEKEAFAELLKRELNFATFSNSLKLMSWLLEKHFGKKTVLLIDEYDVPLAKAHTHGYYEQMLILIRSLFQQALKTNTSLQFAVLTGCMRITKESVFTGLNNLNVLSISDVEFQEFFGFTDKEVKKLLNYYGLYEKYGAIKEWYDGYRFGNTEVYCPWDVVCYCRKLLVEPNALPENYWSNTSGNDAVRHFICESQGSGMTKREIEKLIEGELITKEIHQEITYQDMYDSVDNIWSLLFTTGYLTQRGRGEGHGFRLAIPNLEVREIFTTQIMELFKENVKKDGELLKEFCQALRDGDAQAVEKRFADYLRKTISIRDTFMKKDMKENFYHDILLGILGVKAQWSVSSNKEAGEGYGDILIEIEEDAPMGIVLELKYAQDGNLEAACKEALEQVERRQYGDFFYDEGIDKVLKYGIACYKKRCRVMLADMIHAE